MKKVPAKSPSEVHPIHDDSCYTCGVHSVWYCNDCSFYFCSSCDLMFHSHHSRHDHERNEKEQGSSENMTPPPSPEPMIGSISKAMSPRTLVLRYSPHMTYDQAEIASKLIQIGCDENNVVDAVRNSNGDISNVLNYITKMSCAKCKASHCKGQMIKIPLCEHHVCKQCCKISFATESLLKIVPLSCPECQQIFVTPNFDDEVNLDTFIKPLLSREEYKIFQTKYEQYKMENNPSYRICAQCDCSFLKMVEYRTYSCSVCCTVFCEACENHWTMEHDNKTCEEYRNDMPQNKQDSTSVGKKTRTYLAFGKFSTYLQAEMAVMLIQMNYEENEDFVAAVKSANSIHEAINNLKRTYKYCSLCMDNYLVQEMECMIKCEHSFCKTCIECYFTVIIQERSIQKLVCPECSLPKLHEMDSKSQSYFSDMEIIIKRLLTKEVFELYMKKLEELGFLSLPEFIYCPNNKCNIGYEGNPALKRYRCEYCATTICSKCKMLWEPQHEDLTCALFKEWKDANNPELSKQSINQIFSEKGIQCPNCKVQFEVIHGGCIHYTCNQCAFEFCICGQQFHHGTHDGCQLNIQAGLHCHHPRNCVYYLRDIEPVMLQQLLQENGFPFNVDSLTVDPTCQLLVQKNVGDEHDVPCNDPIAAGQAGLCRAHYIQYLSTLILKQNVDPISILDEAQLIRIIDRDGKTVPPKGEDTTAEGYVQVLQEFIKTNIPL